MSRIFEALQRADIERKSAPEIRDKQPADPDPIPGIEELIAQSNAGIDLDAIARYPWKPFIASFPTLADRGSGVEQFRSLRSRIYQARYEAPVKTILVSSGMPSEGKSFVAANLAMNLARNSVGSILLIDGDLRRPTLHKMLGAPNEPGLSEYLGGSADAQQIMQRDCDRETAETANMARASNLTFIPAGKCGDNSSELVSNRRIEELIAALSPHFDWIIIDSPPVLTVTDAMELCRAADAVLLIARGSITPYDVAQRTQAAFSNSRILGFVLNDVKEVPPRGYAYYDYYSEPSATSRAK